MHLSQNRLFDATKNSVTFPHIVHRREENNCLKLWWKRASQKWCRILEFNIDDFQWFCFPRLFLTIIVRLQGFKNRWSFQTKVFQPSKFLVHETWQNETFRQKNWYLKTEITKSRYIFVFSNARGSRRKSKTDDSRIHLAPHKWNAGTSSLDEKSQAKRCREVFTWKTKNVEKEKFATLRLFYFRREKKKEFLERNGQRKVENFWLRPG